MAKCSPGIMLKAVPRVQHHLPRVWVAVVQPNADGVPLWLVGKRVDCTPHLLRWHQGPPHSSLSCVGNQAAVANRTGEVVHGRRFDEEDQVDAIRMLSRNGRGCGIFWPYGAHKNIHSKVSVRVRRGGVQNGVRGVAPSNNGFAMAVPLGRCPRRHQGLVAL